MSRVKFPSSNPEKKSNAMKSCWNFYSGIFFPSINYLQRGKAAFPPPCFLENRGLEGVWAPPWGFLEGSGRLLGGSWLQEASWVFCRLLSGGSWAAQEPSWGPRWTQVEGQDGSKILPRRPKMHLRCFQDSPRSDFQQKSWRNCLLYTSPSPRDLSTSRMPSSA